MIFFLILISPPDFAHRDALSQFGAGVLKRNRDEVLAAKKMWETAAQADPQAAEPLRSLFRVYLDLGKYTAAVRTARKILELDPEDYKTGLSLGQVLLDGKQAIEAAEVLKAASLTLKIKDDPSTALDVYSSLAKSYESAGQFNFAENALQAMTILHRDQAEKIRRQNRWTIEEQSRMAGIVYERIGLLRIAMQKPVEAAEAFFTAEKLFAGPAQHPNGAARLNRNLAKAFAAAGDLNRAIEHERKYLNSNLEGIESIVEFAEYMQQAGKNTELIRELNLKLQDQPDWRVLKYLKIAAELREKIIDSPTARQQFHELSIVKPNSELLKIAVNVLPAFDVVDWFDEMSHGANPVDKPKTKPDPAKAAMCRALGDAIRSSNSVSKAFVSQVAKEGHTVKVRAFGTYEFTIWLGERIGATKEAESALLATANYHGSWDQIRPLVTHYEQQRKWDKVLETCRPLTTNQRTASVQAIYRSAYACAEMGKAQEALGYVDRMLRDDRLFAEGKLTIRMQLVRIYTSAGEHKKAVALAESLFDDAANPGEVRQIRVVLSDAYFGMKETEKAEAQLRAVLEEDPDDALCLNNLGYNLADRGLKLAEAESFCRRAVEQDRDDRRRAGDPIPVSGTYLDSLGWCLFRRGKLQEARSIFEMATALPDASHDATVWDHYGDVCFKLNDFPGAQKAWEKASQGYPNTTVGRQGGRLAEVQKKLLLVSNGK